MHTDLFITIVSLVIFWYFYNCIKFPELHFKLCNRGLYVFGMFGLISTVVTELWLLCSHTCFFPGTLSHDGGAILVPVLLARRMFTVKLGIWRSPLVVNVVGH
jgi:hypothetical protein